MGLTSKTAKSSSRAGKYSYKSENTYNYTLKSQITQLQAGAPPSDRRHATLAKIMVNLAKSCLTIVKIMANYDTWNACQDHGKITMVSCIIV